jgi:hypothetical protein
MGATFESATKIEKSLDSKASEPLQKVVLGLSFFTIAFKAINIFLPIIGFFTINFDVKQNYRNIGFSVKHPVGTFPAIGSKC